MYKIKTILKLTILTALCMQCVMAGDSISWDVVKTKITKSTPELVKMIEESEDHEFTGRFKFIKKPADNLKQETQQEGGEQPSTRSKSK